MALPKELSMDAALADHEDWAEVRASALERRLAELFKGTQSPPEGEA